MQDYKTINYQQGVIEYGSEETYVSIISKFINMTFEKQLKELYTGMLVFDQKRIEKACFVLKGSVGQILAFEYLQKTNLLYDIVRKPLRDQDIIDLYHRYFDIVDESVQLAKELSQITSQQLNVEEVQNYKETIWPIYVKFMQKYIQEYNKPSENNTRCQKCSECNIY